MQNKKLFSTLIIYDYILFRCLMYVKLFVIMGGTWSMEFISWALNIHDEIWHIFDVINCLKGLWLMIFCVFLSNRVRPRMIAFFFCHRHRGINIANRNAASNNTTSGKREPMELVSFVTEMRENTAVQSMWKIENLNELQ